MSQLKQIKALTISQPFASLIASGEKWVENRSWQTNYRGPLAIHAGKGTQYLTPQEIIRGGLPTGAIVAVCQLRSCVQLELARDFLSRGELPLRMKYDGLTFGDLEAMLAHRHTEGRFCWILTDVKKLDEPFECQGHQGLWDFEPPEMGSVVESPPRRTEHGDTLK